MPPRAGGSVLGQPGAGQHRVDIARRRLLDRAERRAELGGAPAPGPALKLAALLGAHRQHRIMRS
jgi:hypothetical protein